MRTIGDYNKAVARPNLFPAGVTGVASFLLFAAIFLLPLHSQLFYKIIPLYLGLPAGVVAMWKEAVFFMAAFIFAANFLISGKSIRITHIDTAIVFFVILLLCLVVMSDDTMLALYGFRVFVEPLAVYYLARAARIDLDAIKRFLTLFFYLSVLVSIWAVFQAAFLGDAFLISLGYESEGGKLHNSFYIAMFFFQRAVGTFASPNSLGLFLQLNILMGVFLFRTGGIEKKSVYYACNLVLLAGLAYSFSRSSWLALFFSAVFLLFLRNNLLRVFRKSFKFLLIAAAFFIAMYAYAPPFMEPLVKHVANTYTLEDTSTVGHIDSLNRSIDFILSNPVGIGLGRSGPRASERTGEFINSENSFFVLAFDAGVAVASVYIVMLVLLFTRLIGKLKRAANAEVRELLMTTAAVFFGQMVAWNLLPYIVDLDVTILLFFLTGLAMNAAGSQEAKVLIPAFKEKGA